MDIIHGAVDSYSLRKKNYCFNPDGLGGWVGGLIEDGIVPFEEEDGNN